MVGFWGIHVDVLRDTAVRLAPVSPAEACAILDQLRMAPLLRGVRGQAPVDRAALAELIAPVSRLAVALPELVELELNPVVTSPAGAVVVDARATLGI